MTNEQERVLTMALIPVIVALLQGMEEHWQMQPKESFFEISKALSRIEKEMETLP